MNGLQTTALILWAIWFSVPALAQPLLSGPDDIDVPDGHQLVEVPAEYKIATKPIFEPTLDLHTVSPGIYRHFMKDGEWRREIVQAPKTVERMRVGPLRTETVRVITAPKSYVVHDANGRVVKRYRWIRGRLTEV